jgi:hypothetical protein
VPVAQRAVQRHALHVAQVLARALAAPAVG